MRYVRFMSVNELEKFKQGETLENHADWRKLAKTSSSVGFCFFGDEVPPEQRIEYLNGVVNLDRVAVFERIGSEPLRHSMGRYRDPERDTVYLHLFGSLLTPPPMMDVAEYCAESYSSKDMKLVRTGKVVDAFRRVIEWEDEPCCKK